MRKQLRKRVSAGFLIFAAVACAALWLLFVSTWEGQEWVVGAGSILLSVFLMALVRRFSSLKLRMRARDVLHVWRLPWDVISDAWRITVVLFKDLFGSPAGDYFRVCRFRADGSSHATGRAVLVTAATTTSPNSIVLGIDADRQRMLFHQLQRTSIPEIAQELGARP